MLNTIGILNNVSLNIKKNRIKNEDVEQTIMSKVAEKLNNRNSNFLNNSESAKRLISSCNEESDNIILPPPPTTNTITSSNTELTDMMTLSSPKKEVHFSSAFENNSNYDSHIDESILNDINISSNIRSCSGGNLQKEGSVEHSDSILVSKPSVALYIGDLGKDVSEGMLNSFFSFYKSFVSAKVCVDSKTGQSLGYGYLNLNSKDEANYLLERFNYTNIFGNEVRIMPSLRDSSARKNLGTNVFFAELPLQKEDITTRKFYNYFKSYGKILSCKLNLEKNIGFIYFEDYKIASKVIEDYNDNKLFFGKKIMCNVHYDKEVRNKNQITTISDMNKTRKNEDHDEGNINSLTEVDRITDKHDNYIKNRVKKSILIKVFASKIEEKLLLDTFQPFGTIHSVTKVLVSNKELPKRCQQFIITFENAVNLRNILAKTNNITIENKTLKVSIYQPIKTISTGTGNNQRKNKNKKVIYLNNLSSICTIEFLRQFCSQQNIKNEKIEFIKFQNDPLVFTASVLCKNKNDANRLFKSLNNRLIGGSQIRCSWQDNSKGYPFNLYQGNGVPIDNKNDQSVKVSNAYQSEVNSELAKFEQNNNVEQQHKLLLLANQKLLYSINSSEYQNNSPYNFNHPEISKWQVLDTLRKQVNKGLDFIKYPTATRETNLTCITEYIFEVFWTKDLVKLFNFLLTISTNTFNEGILQNQIEKAAETLGFGR